MGLIGQVLGVPAATAAIGQAVGTVAGAFVPNATQKMQAAHDAYVAALAQYGGEFRLPPQGRFDRFVNALNRLPRPFLAFGTIGLFVYAMADPRGFGERMQGLAMVPEPLWWLLAAIVGFYFGARESFHYRMRAPGGPAAAGAGVAVSLPDDGNAALRELAGRPAA